MDYTLFTYSDISSLEWMLKDLGYKVKKKDNNTLVVNVVDAKKGEFIKSVAIFISVICYKYSYKKYIHDKLPNIEDRVIEKIAVMDVENNENKLYIIQNLRILLNEYFKHNDILCLDSFLIFNATGFSKDISFLAQMYCETYEDDMSDFFFSKENIDYLYDAVLNEEVQIDDIVEFEHAVRATREGINLPEDIKHIKRLDLVQKNGRITLLADESKKLELRTLKNLLCLDNDDDRIDNISIIYILVGTIVLFDIEQVVIHKNIPSLSFEYFLKNLLKMKEVGVLENTRIFKCKGDNCPKCSN